MSSTLTSNQLIASIKRRAMLPSDQNTFTPADFLEIVSEEVSMFGVQHLLSTHEDYLLTYIDVPIISGQSGYTIPSRAIGNKLRELQYLDNQNNVYEMSRVTVGDIPDYNQGTTRTSPDIFYVQDSKVILLDASPVDGKLRMYFYLRPNDMVEDKYAAVITDINRTSGVITVSSFQSAFTSLPNIDFIQARTPNKILDYDILPTLTDSNSLTLTFNISEIPADLVIGDYINVAGQTIVPQLPSELHPIIAQRAAVHCLEALGDQQGMETASARLAQMEKATLDLISNRVEEAQQKIVNRHGTLRNAVIGRPRRQYKS